MELSTSIPIPRVRPDIEITFNVIPAKYISTIAKISDIGIAHAMIIVGLISLRNNRRTKIASAAPTRIFCMIDLTIISMYTP